MPLGPNVRYRFKSLGKGKAVRLAFRGKQLLEVASYHSVRGVLKKDKVLHKRR